MNANDLQVIYEVFKLPDASGSSSDRVMSEVKVSGAKKQQTSRFSLGGHPPPSDPPISRPGGLQIFVLYREIQY